jgi:hypothetical protein
MTANANPEIRGMEHIKRSASFRQRDWQPRDRSTTSDVLHDFYIPALRASVRYDRVAGYFRSTSLAAASQGFSALVENKGHVRLVVGADLDPDGSSSITGTTGVSPRPCWRTWPTGGRPNSRVISGHFGSVEEPALHWSTP